MKRKQALVTFSACARCPYLKNTVKGVKPDTWVQHECKKVQRLMVTDQVIPYFCPLPDVVTVVAKVGGKVIGSADKVVTDG